MKYINSREAYLNSVNETFANETTWGGSLIGRLINSIIRKAKIEINDQKVKSIAEAIKIELDGLIANGLSEEDKQEIAKVTAKALLEEIHNVVNSDDTEKEKLYQLLDNENKDGLITQAIKFLEILPEGTNLGRGSKEDLIEKLNRFKSLLEDIDENGEEMTDEEKEKLEEKVDKTEDDDLQETEIGDEGKKEEVVFDDIYNLLQSIVGMHKVIQEKSKEQSPGNNTNNNLPGSTKKNTDGEEAEVIPNSTEVVKGKSGAKQNPNITITKPQPNLLNKGTRDIGGGNQQKQIDGPTEGILNFWSFYNTINELKIDGPKQKGNIEGPKLRVDNWGKKTNNEPKKQGEYIDYEMVDDGDKNNQSNDIWAKILNVWKKSGISEHINTISSLLSKAKDESAMERKWILRIGNQLKVNSLTHGKNMHSKLAESSSDIITTAIPKSISLLANAFFSLKDSNLTKSLGKFTEYLSTFNSCYEQIVVKPKQNLNNTENKELNSPPFGTEKQKETNKELIHAEKVVNKFIKLLNEADTEIAENEHDLEETNTDLTESDKVKNAWDDVFEENEENEWKISSREAKEIQIKLENAKFEINLTDEDNKDRIIKISNLFGKAYKLYVTSRIPSGRPGGKVSNHTFREYIHLGNGTPGSPDDPGAGPWASKQVFHNFSNYISSYIENNDYKRIFNYGTIRRTDGKKILKGNVLLEFIRDMIDETALKSYDKRRSEFLNKYFGLEGYVDRDSNKDYTNNSGDVASIEEEVSWETLNKITIDTPLKVGSFLAINTTFKFKDKGGEILNEHHKIIVGQILKIQEGKILLKWQYNNEAIPQAYAGAVLSKGNKYAKKISSRDDVFVGFIDLNKENETKIGDNIQATKGILPNYNFLMTYFDINKPDKMHYTHYIPTKKKLNSDVVRAGSLKNPISILNKTDKLSNKTVITGAIDKVNKNLIEKDKVVDIDMMFDTLDQYSKTK
jgi:hypothetical protein